MDADHNFIELLPTKRQFKSQSEQEKIKILEQKDKVSTQKATTGAVNQLKDFLLVKNKP